MRILLAAISIRALAQSAVRAGYDVCGVDYFGDRDMPAMMETRSLTRKTGRKYNATDLVGLAQDMEYDALVYGSNLENHPGVVRKLCAGRPVLGNSPQTLAQARHWPTVVEVCRQEDILMPETLFDQTLLF